MNYPMIDHASLAVKNYIESRTFYDETLKILGYTRVVTIETPEMQVAGYGYEQRQRPYFWISEQGNANEEVGSARGVHFAFVAKTVEDVQNWYQACLEKGGTNNGEPGPRKEYHPGYYGAFIIDPNGWRIEACLHHYSN